MKRGFIVGGLIVGLVCSLWAFSNSAETLANSSADIETNSTANVAERPEQLSDEEKLAIEVGNTLMKAIYSGEESDKLDSINGARLILRQYKESDNKRVCLDDVVPTDMLVGNSEVRLESDTPYRVDSNGDKYIPLNEIEFKGNNGEITVQGIPFLIDIRDYGETWTMLKNKKHEMEYSSIVRDGEWLRVIYLCKNHGKAGAKEVDQVDQVEFKVHDGRLCKVVKEVI